MAGGAHVAPPGPVINRLRAISRTVIGGQWTAKGRASIIKADPGAGVPAISGGEPYSTATVDGRRRCDQPERRTASVYLSVKDVRPSSAALVPTSMGSVAAMKVMKGFMIEMMNPLARDDAALITLFDSPARCHAPNRFVCDEPLHDRIDEPPELRICALSRSKSS
jgi:hypothetical protein